MARGPAALTWVQMRRPTLSASAISAGSSTVRILPIAHHELAVDHHRLDVGRLAVVNPRRDDAARGNEVGAQGVDDQQVGLLADFERAHRLLLIHRARAAERRVLEHVFRLRPDAGERIVAANAFGQQRDPHHLEQVVGVVVGAVGDGAAGRAQRRDRRNHAAVGGHAGLVRHDRARLGEQRDVALVHVAAVSRKQARTEEAVTIEVRRRAHAMVLHHEVHLGAALRQVDGVAEVVLLGERAHRLQQLRRRGLGQCGGREHADASLVLAVPRREQIVDALQPVIAQLRPKTAASRSWPGRRAPSVRPRSRCRAPLPQTPGAGPSPPARRRAERCRSTSRPASSCRS